MNALSHFKLQQACKQLEEGDLIAYPTEAVYGLGCDPLNEAAVLNLLALKQRSIDKGLILIASDFSQLEIFLKVDEKILQRINQQSTDTITWIIPTQAWTPKWLTGSHQSLAVRVTNHPLSKALCAQFGGAIVSTSANPNNKKPARNALQVRQYFSKFAELQIIHGQTGGNKNPSKIYDAVSGKCLRS